MPRKRITLGQFLEAYDNSKPLYVCIDGEGASGKPAKGGEAIAWNNRWGSCVRVRDDYGSHGVISLKISEHVVTKVSHEDFNNAVCIYVAKREPR